MMTRKDEKPRIFPIENLHENKGKSNAKFLTPKMLDVINDVSLLERAVDLPKVEKRLGSTMGLLVEAEDEGLEPAASGSTEKFLTGR